MAKVKSGEREPHSLRRIVTGALIATFVGFAVIFMTVFYSNMTNMLSRMESEHATELGVIVRGTLEANLADMRSSTRLWSSDDRLYDFAITGDDSMLRENLKTGTGLTVSGVDYVIIKDPVGNDLFVGSRSDGDAGGLPEGLSERISEISAEVLSHSVFPTRDVTYEGQYCDTGFVVVNGKSYMLCVAPVLPTGENAVPAGTFTLIKEFGDKQFAKFTQMEGSRFYIAEQYAHVQLMETSVTAVNNDYISLTTHVNNLGNDRGAVLRFDAPRTLYNKGYSIIILISIVVGLLLLGIITVLYIVLDRYLLRPIAKLKVDLAKVDQNEMLNPDEYGQYLELHLLVHTINDSIFRLEQSHRLIRQSEISLGAVTSILNGLDSFMYVTDPETDEILFMNDLMKEYCGFTTDPVGKICWQILQSGKTTRCDFCPCYELEKNPDHVQVWEQYNEVTGRIHHNTDTFIEWAGGKRAHLQHVVDVTDERAAEESLKRRLSQQTLMSKLSQNFLVDDDLDFQIDRALEIVGEFMDARRVMLYSTGANWQVFTGENEWISPKWDIQPYLGISIVLEDRDAPIIDKMANRKIPVLNSGVDGGRLLGQYTDTTSYLIAPIFVSGKLWGSIDVRGAASEEWTESDVSLVTLTAGIISVALDRRLMEKQFRSISSIVQYSPQFICYVDKNTELTYVNPSVLPITGYSEEELMSKGFHTLFDDETFAKIRDEFVPDTIKNGTNQFEIEMIRKSGKRRILSVSTFIVGDGSGYVGGIAHDITKTRRLERELIAAKELAEQGSRAKGEFLSRMSHEMRTPMNAIIGMTNIAKSSGDIKKKEYCLEKIENASLHLLGVINDVLDMSKIEAEKFEISESEFSFDNMLTNVINVINFRIDEKFQTLSLVVDPSIPSSLIGDEQRLDQVIINLLTNAVKFTPENGVIGLSFKLLDAQNGDLHIEIKVSDNGIGISPEQQTKLFRSFEQADNSIARKFGGTGLGLVISKHIVQLMGGDIRLESEVGKGSTFTFDIRVKRGAEGTLETGRRKFSGKDLNILMADDSPETRDYFQYVMDSFQIPCQVAYDGINALEIINSSKRPLDLIFVDWKMPNMNGIELTKEIRKLKESDPVVVMISVAEWSDIEKEATEAGVDGFVPKPLFPSLIMDCINKYVGSLTERNSAEADASADSDICEYLFAGKVALLAEDVDINREIVLTILQDTQIEIDCAKNGLEAIEMFEKNPDRYNIIVMDVHMPEVDGLEATRRIRAMDFERARQVPIIAMTANVFREDIDECIKAGMNDHIGKPIDFNELLVKLDNYLN